MESGLQVDNLLKTLFLEFLIPIWVNDGVYHSRRILLIQFNWEDKVFQSSNEYVKYFMNKSTYFSLLPSEPLTIPLGDLGSYLACEKLEFLSSLFMERLFLFNGVILSFLQNLLFYVPFRYQVTDAISVLTMLQMSPAIDVWLFLVSNAQPRLYNGIEIEAKQTHQERSHLGQGQAAASPRAPAQVATQWEAKTRENSPSSLAGQWVITI